MVDFRRLMLVSEQANLQEPDFKPTVLASRSEQGPYSVCSKITSQTPKEIYLLSNAVRTVPVALITVFKRRVHIFQILVILRLLTK